jgi:hypothetical protein
MGIGDDTAPNALSRHTHKTKKVINVDILFLYTAVSVLRLLIGFIESERKKKRKRKRLYSQSLNETQSITNRIALVITAV